MRLNYKRLSNGFYLVRTQAGFKRAIKDWVDPDYEQPDQEGLNYPKSYPSIVNFYSFYHGYHAYNCSCRHLNEYKQLLTKVLEECTE